MFEDLIPELQAPAQELVNLVTGAGVRFTVTSTLRTHSQQARLYRSFLRGERHYPVAPPGTSAHEFGYAFDAVSDPFENQGDIGQVWRQWGGVWSTKDDVHFEYPGFVAPPAGASAGGCDLSNWRSWVFWNPDCACMAVDFLKGSWVASLVEAGFGQSEISRLFSAPCTTILQNIKDLGL